MNEAFIYREKGKDTHFKIWHALEENMFIYTYSNGGSIVCSEKIYPIKAGTLCFIGAGKYHYTMPDNPESYDRSKVFILPENMARALKPLSSDSSFRKFSEGGFVYANIPEAQRDEAERIFEDLEKYRDNEYFEAVLTACCIRLLVLAERFSIEQTEPVGGAVNKAIDYINSNIFRDMDIDEICAAIHISKYHFCRRFKECTGMTVMNYILKTRIILAKNLLLSEKASVTEISQHCGFSSLSYFSRAFKDETGMTPLEYRKKNNI